MPDQSSEVSAAVDRIRVSLRKQEAEMIDSFGTSLGPGTPRPARADLLTLLRHLGVADDEQRPGACGVPAELWDVTTYCVRDAHPVDRDNPHENRWGTRWWPNPEETIR
jgi:hypothetical protein